MLDTELWKFHDIWFDPVPHKYTNSKGTPYESVTTWVKKFSPPQDWDSIAKKAAEKRGTTAEALRQEWKLAGEYSCALGTEVHAIMENMMQRKHYEPKISPKWPGMEGDIASRLSYCKNAYEELTKRYVPVREEFIVHNPDWGLCGTIDLLAYDTEKESLAILDYKTNKEIKTENRWSTMMAPFSTFADCEFYHYSLQLSTYKAIIESMTDLKVGDLKLIHITPHGYKIMECVDVSGTVARILGGGCGYFKG